MSTEPATPAGPSVPAMPEEPAGGVRLTKVPSVEVGMLIRRPPGEVFRAFVEHEVVLTLVLDRHLKGLGS